MEAIRLLNDNFRRTFHGGRVCTTNGIALLPEDTKIRILDRVRSFEDFDEDNDPHGEHDFGTFSIDGMIIFFKIDYYDQCCQAGSEDPSDPKKTTRVLTILRAEEW